MLKRLYQFSREFLHNLVSILTVTTFFGINDWVDIVELLKQEAFAELFAAAAIAIVIGVTGHLIVHGLIHLGRWIFEAIKAKALAEILEEKFQKAPWLRPPENCKLCLSPNMELINSTPFVEMNGHDLTLSSAVKMFNSSRVLDESTSCAVATDWKCKACSLVQTTATKTDISYWISS